ncbi:MAG: type 1 glutamine amidotransferase domain-containing protein [Candidatus Dormibacteria bacterium]
MRLEGKRIALLVGPGFDEAETIYPYYRLLEEGAQVDIVSAQKAESGVAGHQGITLTVGRDVADCHGSEYAGLVIPGGRGPDRLRWQPEVLRFVKEFFDGRKPVASVCHAPQILINAEVLKGVHLTSWVSVAKDVQNAGGLYEDSEVVVDREAKLVSSRSPADLPAWLRATVDMFAGEGVAK